MSEQKENVGIVANGLNVPVKITREFLDWTNEETGKRYKSVKIRVSFVYDEEDFRLTVHDKDSRLLMYLLKKAGVPVLDEEGNIITKHELEKLLGSDK